MKKIILFSVILIFTISNLSAKILVKNMKSIYKLDKWTVNQEFYCSKSIERKNQYVIFSFDSPNRNSLAQYVLKLPSVNLKGLSKLKIKLNNMSDKSVQVSFAFITAQGNKFWELPIKKIIKGQNEIEYDLTKSIYAHKGNGWQYKDTISGEDNVIGFAVLIYPESKLRGKIGIEEVKIEVDTDIIRKAQEEEKLYETFENFEDTHPWGAALWSKASSVSYSYKIKSQGLRGAKLNFSSAGEHVFFWYFDSDKNMSAYDKLRLDVYVPDTSVKQIRLNFFTGKNFKWHQSKYFSVGKGWNKQYSIDIKPSDFTPNLDSNSISGMAVHIISAGSKSGYAVIDNIELKRKKENVPIQLNLKKKFQAMLSR